MLAQPINKRLWTEDEDAFIRENWRTMTDAELSKALDRSLGSLRQRLATLCITRKSLTWRHSEIVAMARDGASLGEIADSLGVSLRQVTNYCWTNKIKTSTRTNRARQR